MDSISDEGGLFFVVVDFIQPESLVGLFGNVNVCSYYCRYVLFDVSREGNI